MKYTIEQSCFFKIPRFFILLVMLLLVAPVNAHDNENKNQQAFCNKHNPIVGNWMFSNPSLGFEGAFQFNSNGLYTSSNLDDLPSPPDFPVGYYSTGLFGQWEKKSANVYLLKHVEKIALKNTAIVGLPAIFDQNNFPPSPAVGYTTAEFKITGNTGHVSATVNVYPAGTTNFNDPPLFTFPIELDMHRFGCN